MITCLIFDLDGTIGNTEPLCLEAFHQALEPWAGRKISDQEIMDAFGPSEKGIIRALLQDHREEALHDYIQCYKEMHDAICPAPFEGIRELLSWARNQGIHIAMVTGKSKPTSDYTLHQFGIASYFEVVENGIAEKEIKPEGIRNVLEQLGIPAGEALYIGDKPGDIQAAREAGIPVASACWAPAGDEQELRKAQPDQLFTSVAQLMDYLQQQIEHRTLAAE
ncbi:HAD family hydrolase [Paenibacillus bovis]|uniref:Hydrolase n=1 Tax=Paenibacillus bovis TaxID=1616788 RepID=A0A172ZCP7_9BACL|nr:HAD family hydrolase [Paenibacillus bovis]ANF95283.1 hydrolase [Paenibacillus bovis]